MSWYVTVTLNNGIVRFLGVAGGTLRIHSESASVLVVHEAGHGYWSGIGQPQAYAPAQFHVLNITDKTEFTGSSVLWHTEKVITFPVRGDA